MPRWQWFRKARPKKPSIAGRLREAQKKAPLARGSLHLHLHDPDASLSAPAGRGQKFVAEKSPSFALRRVASSRTQYLSRLERWGLPPAEPQGRRVYSRHHSFRTARKWCGRRYPCPRRCSEFLPLSLHNSSLQTLLLVRFPHQPGSRKTAPNSKQTRCQCMDAA